MAIIKGKNRDWEIIIGLEIHAQIVSSSKLFSTSPTEFNGEQNTQVSFLDAGMPGMLPVLNIKCVEQAVKTGLGLNSRINYTSVFDRKSYFYPDLPQGYQISQFNKPIVEGGVVTIHLPEEQFPKDIRITRIHIEQDAGKSIHDQNPYKTFIDLNRAGIGLMEIVTEPDLRSPEEAAEFMRKLRSILRYLGTCDGNMEQGSLRCDANVSVRPLQSKEFGTRVEIKNLNSIRFIAKAITYEAQRQVNAIENGEEINQETRLFDTVIGETRTMRDKEDATDYRYFPDPDLLPLTIDVKFVESIKQTLPELPDIKMTRYVEEMGLSKYDANVITADKEIANYFEQVAKKSDPKLAANWITSELFGKLNKTDITIEQSPISADNLSALLEIIADGTISGKIAKDVFDIMFSTGDNPLKIVDDQGLRQISNKDELNKIIDEVLNENVEQVERYITGEVKILGFLVGQIMKKTQNKANPQLINQYLKDRLIKNK